MIAGAGKIVGVSLGGPNFIQSSAGDWIAAGRRSENGPPTELSLLEIGRGRLLPLLTLPSGGDASYPGMVWYDEALWVSHYSSHEDRTSVYLARIRLTR
jgi:hypothetical protein